MTVDCRYDGDKNVSSIKESIDDRKEEKEREREKTDLNRQVSLANKYYK